MHRKRLCLLFANVHQISQLLDVFMARFLPRILHLEFLRIRLHYLAIFTRYLLKIVCYEQLVHASFILLQVICFLDFWKNFSDCCSFWIVFRFYFCLIITEVVLRVLIKVNISSISLILFFQEILQIFFIFLIFLWRFIIKSNISAKKNI